MAVNKASLPFPALGPVVRCLRCDYDLAGLGDIVCPECGEDYGRSAVLWIAGVPRRSETRLWRRAAWAVVIVIVFVMTQLWPFFFLTGEGIVAGIVLLGTIVAGVALARTGRARKHTVERIVFSKGGISRAEWRRPGAPTEVMLWPREMYVRVVPVGTVWQKLIVEDHEAGRKRYFECGFRCERERLAWVQRTILALARGEEAPSEESSAESPMVP